MTKSNIETDLYSDPLDKKNEKNTNPNDNIDLFYDLCDEEDEDFSIPGLFIFQN